MNKSEIETNNSLNGVEAKLSSTDGRFLPIREPKAPRPSPLFMNTAPSSDFNSDSECDAKTNERLASPVKKVQQKSMDIAKYAMRYRSLSQTQQEEELEKIKSKVNQLEPKSMGYVTVSAAKSLLTSSSSFHNTMVHTRTRSQSAPPRLMR